MSIALLAFLRLRYSCLFEPLLSILLVALLNGSGHNNSNITSIDIINMTKTPFASPEYNVQSENYLNLYHGIDDLDPTKITHFANLSDDEKTNFDSFVQQVKEYDFTKELKQTSSSNDSDETMITPDEMTMLRFLQSDDYDTTKALKRLVATLKWHQEIQLGSKMSTRPAKLDVYRKIRVRAFMGRTKTGMPIFVERLAGFMNGIPSKEGKSLTQEDWIHCFLYDMGGLLQELRDTYTTTTTQQQENNGNNGSETQKEITWKATWIMDCRGQSMYKAMKAMSTIKMIDALTEPNFPEFAGPIYLINAPSIVAGIWKIAKAFLDPAVVSKIQIHSNIPKELLLETMDEKVLFQEYGGLNPNEFPQSDYV